MSLKTKIKAKYFIGLFVTVCSLAVIAAGIHSTVSAASTYYVSPSGNNTNAGTINAPWKTITFAATKLAPGDVLYIRGGTYLERARFTISGTAAQPIRIQAYPGETPIIDGTYTIPTSSFSALVVLSGSYLEVDGLEAQNSLWQGISVSGSNVTVSNVVSHDHYEQGIIVFGATNSIVQDSISYNNAKSFENGVHKLGRTSYATGLSAAGQSTGTILRRNTTYHNWGEGLSTFNTYNTIMEDNVVYDNAKNVYISDATGTILRRNLIYCTAGNDRRLSNTVTQHGINLQDEVLNPVSSNTTIVNNLVTGCVDNFKWFPYTSNSAMTNVLVANNTFMNATGSTSDGSFHIASPVGISHSNTRITNNIIVQEDSRTIGFLGSPSTGITFSNNLWSKSPPASMTGTGDLVTDPLISKTGSFTPGNLTAAYFKFSTSSPAINAGSTLTEVTEDYFKTLRPFDFAPDIGAYEDTTDLTSPTVGMTSPSNNATLSGDATLTANATDNINLAGVQFKIDGVSYGNEDTTSPYSVVWDTLLFSDGSHTITAVARDTSGNTTTSSPISVTLSNAVIVSPTPPVSPTPTPPPVSPPATPPVSPPAGSSGSGITTSSSTSTAGSGGTAATSTAQADTTPVPTMRGK